MSRTFQQAGALRGTIVTAAPMQVRPKGSLPSQLAVLLTSADADACDAAWPEREHRAARRSRAATEITREDAAVHETRGEGTEQPGSDTRTQPNARDHRAASHRVVGAHRLGAHEVRLLVIDREQVEAAVRQRRLNGDRPTARELAAPEVQDEFRERGGSTSSSPKRSTPTDGGV